VSLLDEAFDSGPASSTGAGDDHWQQRRTTSLVVVDPHAAVREGLPVLLRPHGIEVAATTSTGDGAEAVIGRHQPDVALVALELADVDGIVLLRRLIARGTRSAVVLYADVEDAQQSALALHAGAAGIVGTRRPVAELSRALEAVAAGGLWFTEPGELDSAPTKPAMAVLNSLYERRTARLSSAERRVLELVAEGRSTESMADALSLSPHTIRTHLRNVMRKLEASSRAHAVAIAIREEAIQV
jgi:DNA-binding NarL/FixJ family response regulator